MMRASEQVMKESRGIVGRAELIQQKDSLTHTHAHAHVSLCLSHMRASSRADGAGVSEERSERLTMMKCVMIPAV